MVKKSQREHMKIRLFRTGKKQVDLIPLVQDALPEYVIDKTDISEAISGSGIRPKHEAIRKAVDKILTELEKGA